MLLEVDLVVRLVMGGRRPRPAICSWEFWSLVVGIGNTSRESGQLELVSVLPPLRNNLPSLELRNNQPLVEDRPPLVVVLPPLEGESTVVLPVLLILCCVVPLLLQSRFLPSLF